MRASFIRPPYAELILWGIKTASRGRARRRSWMTEPAEQVKMIEAGFL
jgi:hypothetical protein